MGSPGRPQPAPLRHARRRSVPLITPDEVKDAVDAYDADQNEIDRDNIV
jgi:hypothetical protein